MRITRVNLQLNPEPGKNVAAIASVYFSNTLVVNRIKVICCHDGTLRAIFPHSRSGEPAAAPLSVRARAEIEDAIQKEYERTILKETE